MKVTLYLGPTNSGKTYLALQELIKSGEGAYAGPLRMLAQEVYEKLSKEINSESVGLHTGEQLINDGAKIMVCTAECAPRSGKTLVLDEVHWMNDPDRGFAWTKLIADRLYEEYHICGPNEAEEILMKAFKNTKGSVKVDDIKIIKTERRSQLVKPVKIFTFSTKSDDISLPAAFITFSRKACLRLAKKLARFNPVVVYGAMPPENRVKEIDKLITGKSKAVITTDIIGHGINLPISSIVICETTKFDGRCRRDLHTWELAQIIGRAGRNQQPGHVWIMRFDDLECQKYLVDHSIDVANGTYMSDLELKKAEIIPSLSELAVTDPKNLGQALEDYSKKYLRHPWIKKMDLNNSLMQKYCRLMMILYNEEISMPIERIWNLMRIPVSDKYWETLVQHLVYKMPFSFINPDPSDSCEDLESKVDWINNLRIISTCLDNMDGYIDRKSLEKAYSDGVNLIESKILQSIMNSNLCEFCNRKISSLRHNYCDDCYYMFR